jgi:ankyrin repeat protein
MAAFSTHSTTPSSSAALLLAAKDGDVAGVERALTAGADVDVRDAREMTALMHAADKGRLGCVRVLVAAGADVNAREEFGK